MLDASEPIAVETSVICHLEKWYGYSEQYGVQLTTSTLKRTFESSSAGDNCKSPLATNRKRRTTFLLIFGRGRSTIDAAKLHVRNWQAAGYFGSSLHRANDSNWIMFPGVVTPLRISVNSGGPLCYPFAATVRANGTLPTPPLADCVSIGRPRRGGMKGSDVAEAWWSGRFTGGEVAIRKVEADESRAVVKAVVRGESSLSSSHTLFFQPPRT
ncbi:hypothetical protein K0M31_017928 [Melipona bicolor]|uniref:Uncharacterized protein n=1 Tax=Melipona bicolor TaxID=60889 RepID=A0AA40KSV9_9HYME|nr:hypothetical protein K0M31_017928 [Melipona bicolor]